MFWIFELDSLNQPASRDGSVALEIFVYQPTEEEIRLRAYEIFIARGGEHGAEQDDWEQAERELRERQITSS